MTTSHLTRFQRDAFKKSMFWDLVLKFSITPLHRLFGTYQTWQSLSVIFSMKLILSLLNVGLEIYWKFLSNLYFYRYFKTNLNFSRHWLIWKSKSISISLLIDYLNPIRLLSCVGQVKLQSSMVRSDETWFQK